MLKAASTDRTWEATVAVLCSTGNIQNMWSTQFHALAVKNYWNSQTNFWALNIKITHDSCWKVIYCPCLLNDANVGQWLIKIMKLEKLKIWFWEECSEICDQRRKQMLRYWQLLILQDHLSPLYWKAKSTLWGTSSEEVE